MTKRTPTRIQQDGETPPGVAALNNLGVQYFEAKNYQRAVELFRDALKRIMSPVRDVGRKCQERSPAEQATSSTNPFTPILKAKTPNDDCVNDSQHFLCFSQALDVTEFSGAYSGNQMVNEVFLSAIIIWNLGLVYHCTSQGRQDRLRRASTLYLKSWSLVEAFVSSGSSGNLVVDFFTQALLNNLGSCFEQLDHVQDARMWSDHSIMYAHSITASLPYEPMDTVSGCKSKQTILF